jgi:hypothetical protein
MHNSAPIPSFCKLWHGVTLHVMREEDSMAENLWPDGHTGSANQWSESVVFNPQSQHMQIFERFVAVMYSKYYGLASTLQHWQEISGSLVANTDTLYQHICRTVMQTTIWSQTNSVHMDITDFQEWGWHKDSSDRWLPYWTTPEDSSKACSILLHCGCMKSCTRNCKCSRNGVGCKVLCKCEGGYVNNEDAWTPPTYDCVAVYVLVLNTWRYHACIFVSCLIEI